MRVTVKNLKQRGGVYYFRRAYPKDLKERLRADLGKAWGWDVSLQTRRLGEAEKAVEQWRRETDKLIAELRRKPEAGETAFQRYSRWRETYTMRGVIAEKGEGPPEEHSLADTELDRIADAVAARMTRDGLRDDIGPDGHDRRDEYMSADEESQVAALTTRPPEITIRDAVVAYRAWKFGDDAEPNSNTERPIYALNSLLSYTNGNDPHFADIDLTFTQAFIDHLFDQEGLSEAYVNSIRNTFASVHKFAHRRLLGVITTAPSPWREAGLAPKQKKRAAERRRPRAQFSAHHYRAIFERLDAQRDLPEASRLNNEARNILVLSLLTGGRTQDARGLAIGDLHLEGPVPYCEVTERPWRELKTQHSQRKVPLVGRALAAAAEARERAAKEGRTSPDQELFTRYARPRGGSALSVVLNAFLKNTLDDADLKVHSARHSAIYWLRNADVPRDVREAFAGHSFKETNDRYGGGWSVELLRNSWISALDKAGVDWR